MVLTKGSDYTMKRIFVAINISDRLKKKVSIFRQKYNNLPVRWMPEENLHLTLIPPMELSDNEMVEMIEKIKKVEGEFGPMTIKFNKVSFGPDLSRPRLIWAKSEKNLKLESLKNRITDILGLRNSGRADSFHLTLARFKPRDYANFKIKDLRQEVNWAEKAESIKFIQSECLAEGARYTNLAEIDL